MDNIVNFSLLKNPTNWVIVILMWMLGTMLAHYVTMHFNGQNSKGN